MPRGASDAKEPLLVQVRDEEEADPPAAKPLVLSLVVALGAVAFGCAHAAPPLATNSPMARGRGGRGTGGSRGCTDGARCAARRGWGAR